jgi:hypothetical protein
MKKELWLRLRGYRFEHLVPSGRGDHIAAAFGKTDPWTRAFARKISGKHGRARPFALRVIAEYKKFVHLGLVADFPVTPPRLIDVVWHEHILFSAAYPDCCQEVLGRPFDHHPELVADAAQTAVFARQFHETVALYRAEFGVAPRHDIWGTPKLDARTSRTEAPPSRRRELAGPASSGSDAMPLHACFDAGSSGAAESASIFGDGGGFSGGGGGDGWASDSASDAGGEGGAGDGGGGDAGAARPGAAAATSRVASARLQHRVQKGLVGNGGHAVGEVDVQLLG